MHEPAGLIESAFQHKAVEMGIPSTNHYGATADGIILAYRVGVSFRFMNASQFHPTGVIYPEQNVGLLITEKVRVAGAQLLNREGGGSSSIPWNHPGMWSPRRS